MKELNKLDEKELTYECISQWKILLWLRYRIAECQ